MCLDPDVAAKCNTLHASPSFLQSLRVVLLQGTSMDLWENQSRCPRNLFEIIENILINL